MIGDLANMRTNLNESTLAVQVADAKEKTLKVQGGGPENCSPEGVGGDLQCDQSNGGLSAGNTNCGECDACCIMSSSTGDIKGVTS